MRVYIILNHAKLMHTIISSFIRTLLRADIIVDKEKSREK